MKDKEKIKQLIDEILQLRKKIADAQSGSSKNKSLKKFNSVLPARYIENEKVLKTILNASLAILDNDDFATVSLRIIQNCMELSGAANGYIAFSTSDGNGDVVLFIDSQGKGCPLTPYYPLPIQGLRKEVYRTGNAIYHNNFSEFAWDELSTHRSFKIKNVLLAPVLINSTVRALFCLANKTGGFNDDDLSIVPLFSSYIAVALQRNYERDSLPNFNDFKEPFGLIADASCYAVICLDTKDNLIFWNKASENIFGYAENEILGQPVSLLLPERFRSVSQDLFKRLDIVENNFQPQKTQNFIGIRKDGVEFSAELSPASWAIGREKIFIGIIRKIAESTKAEYTAHQYIRLFEGFGGIFWEADPETKHYLFVSSSAEKITGFPASQWLEEPDFLMNHLHPDDQQKWQAFYSDIIDKAANYEFEFRFTRADGTTIWLRNIITVAHINSKTASLKGILVNISNHKHSQEDTDMILSAIEQSDDLMLISDINGIIEYVNKAMERLTGYSRYELIGQNMAIFHPGWNTKKIYRDIRESLLSGSSYNEIVPCRTKDGKLIEVFQSFIPIKNKNNINITRFAASAKEITNHKTTKERLIFLAYHDPITGLPNRSIFLDRLNQAMAGIKYKKTVIAILIADINRLKFINEAYGFETGDAALKRVGDIFLRLIPEYDSAARLENDEFAISFVDVNQTQDIVNLAELIIKKTSEPFMVDQNEIKISVSIGISVYPEDGNDAEEIIRKAYLALSKAKETKRKYKFYTQDINAMAAEIVQIETNLFKSLKKEEFILHYQPYFEMNTKKIMGIEALVRWDSIELGIVPPGKFIPLLEENGMIIELGKWILKSAIRQLRDWKDKGYSVHPISINLSKLQFRQRDLQDLIYMEINRNEVDPSLIVLEITEKTFMHDIEYSKNLLKNLKDIGVSISIDDFGTGYSSLSSLKSIPVDNLKIDISFIKSIAFDPDVVSIVTTIITLAHNLNLKTIAEGVETEDQWKVLKLLRCDLAQGYYLSRPLSPDSLAKLLL